MSVSRPIRLGIIGIGNMGSAHANNILEGKCPDFVLSAVADRKPERLQWAKENLGENIVLFDDGMKLIESGKADACIISVPHYDHPTLAIACLKKGLHVMVEKPAGVYTKQVRQMNEEAARHPELSFAMMFNQRTNCVYKKMRDMVRSGQYGALRRTNWIITSWYRPQAYYDSGDWRATWAGEGGGVLLNQCPHQLDLWQWICGMPVRVEAHMAFGKWHQIEVEDDVTVYAEYSNGASGVFITSTGDAHGTNRFEIQLDRARLVAEEDALSVTEYEMTEQEWSRRNTVPFASVPSRTFFAELDGANPQHVGVLNAWAGNILRGAPLIASGAEGIQGLMLSNAIHLSAFLQKTVDIPIDEELYYAELQKRILQSKEKEHVVAQFADTSGTY